MLGSNPVVKINEDQIKVAECLIAGNSWRGKKYAETNFAADSISDLVALVKISVAYVSAQQSGPKLQRWMESYANWIKVKESDDRGDSRTRNYRYVEQKWTLQEDKAAHGVQCRLWQNNDGYVFGSVNPKNDKVEMFYLTKEEMNTEVRLLNSSASHGTKAANKANGNIEYTVSVPMGSVHHTRWKEKYAKPLEFFKTI